MLSDHHQHLITAAVDGELSADERAALQKLLKRSVEARELFHRLRQDARRLRRLPRAQLPAHFSTEIVQKIGGLNRPVPSEVEAGPSRWFLPASANVAAAAAVLLAVCVGSYLVFVTERTPSIPTPSAVARKTEVEPSIPSRSTPPAVAHDSSKPERIAVRPSEVVDVAATEPKVVEPGSSEVLATPFKPKMEPFTVDPPKLPPIFAVRDLDQPATKAKLTQALKTEDALHLDLFCRDGHRGFERLQSALKARGVRLLIDAVAQERLKIRLRTEYVLYCEALTVEDLSAALQQLSAEERKEPAVESLVVGPMTVHARKTLSMLLGVDPKQIPTKGKVSHDPSRPVSDDTADHLAKSLGKSPGAPSAIPTDEKLGLILSYNPIRPNPGSSKEVRQFLTSRRDAKPNTVPVLLVLRLRDTN